MAGLISRLRPAASPIADMSRKRSKRLPFDSKGGVIVMPSRMLKSNAYLSLKPQAKVLVTLLQLHWSNSKPVDYGIREAAAKTPCDRKTAIKAFKQLREHGFIECVEQSMFNSRENSRSRGWRLTWMPYHGREPTNEWEKKEEN